MEQLLGASAQSRSEPDFVGLGIELKTIPLTRHGRPLETTFVCTIPLLEVGDTEWVDSRVYNKLRRVLWVPVMAERDTPIGERQVGCGFLWSPTPAQESALRWDWEELAGLIGRGEWESVTGRLGAVLQVRPKAADGAVRRRAISADGLRIEVLPRGFYLRTNFTAEIVAQQFGLSST